MDTDPEYKTRTYKETNVINIQYEGKSEQVNEDAKKSGIKIKLKWITKRCKRRKLFGKISRYSSDPRSSYLR